MKTTDPAMNELISVVDNPGEWDTLVEMLPLSSLFLTATWGEYKSRKGWNVARLKIDAALPGKPAGLLQLQWKQKGLLTLFNVQGGIHVFDTSGKEDPYEYCLNALKHYLDGKAGFWMLMTSYDAHELPPAKIALLKAGFAPVLTSGMFTYLVNCTGEVTENMLSSNWRHNLKRAQKNTKLVTRWAETAADRTAAMQRASLMYDNLMQRKNFAAGVDVRKISDLVVRDKNMLICEAVLDTEVVAIRVVHVAATHVLDFLAASNDAAKNCYANYLLIWAMIGRTRMSGKSYFDAGGIDPCKNAGVFNFKKGLGGNLAVNGPLWVAASNGILKKSAQAMLCLLG